MRVLVTGGEGFVGKNIVNRLINDGHEVGVIVSGGAELANQQVAKIFHTNIAGIDICGIIDFDPEAIIHTMANNDTLYTSENGMYIANVKSSEVMMNIALSCKSKYFIWASSTAVYGNSATPFKEYHTPLLPLNIYAEMKLEFDSICQVQMRMTDKVSNWVGLRFCNIYGPGEEHKNKRMSMIGQIINQVLDEKQPEIFTDGSQKRDWVHVFDIADVCSEILERDEVKNGVYNIANGNSVTFNEIVSLIGEASNKALTPNYIDCPFLSQYQTDTECDIENAKRELGFEPKFSLRSGIKQYYDYLSGKR